MKYIIGLFLIILFNQAAAQEDFEKWLGKENKKFESYISENDKQFSDFLKKNWKEFQLQKGVVEETIPKPKTPPVFKSENEKIADPKPVIEKKEEVKVPIKEKIVPSLTPAIPIEAPKEKQLPKSVPDKNEKPKEVLNNTPVQKEEIPLSKLKVVEEPKVVIEKKEIPNPTLTEKNPENPVVNSKPVISESLKPVKEPAAENEISFDYYGIAEQAPLIAKLNIDKSKKIDGNLISDFWLKISATNYNEVLKSFQNEKSRKNINDWGYFMMVKKYSEKIFPAEKNYQNLLTWHFLIKSNYKVKVGLVNDNVFLFMPCKQNLFFIPYFKGTDVQDKIYLVNLDNLQSSASGSLYTHEKDYPGADKILDMNLYANDNYSRKTVNKILKFGYDRKEYQLKIAIDSSLISFYRKYPNCQYDVYFNARVQPSITDELLPQLREIIKGKSEYESVNMILRFCQTAFGYKMDDENFGMEKTLFVDETLFYPFSDCEDRSVIFSYLVRALFGLDVIGIDYPGHVATAVKFKTDVKGFEVNYKNQKYILCDPTYIGASIGDCMPSYMDSKFEVIETKQF